MESFALIDMLRPIRPSTFRPSRAARKSQTLATEGGCGNFPRPIAIPVKPSLGYMELRAKCYTWRIGNEGKLFVLFDPPSKCLSV
jgi:hypothetical protein